MRISTLAVIAAACWGASAAGAATLDATYVFNGSLNAQESGAPPLTATNPLGTNSFSTDTVFGGAHTVYEFNSDSSNNAGLTFDDASSLISPSSYSVEMVFELSSATGLGSGSGWRRLVDSQDRSSDDGLYVDPNNNFDIYPNGAGTATFSTGTYFDMILTDDGTTASVYVNGVLDFSEAAQGAGLNQMNLNNANNPGQLLNLFLDNTVGGGQGEFSGGKIALLEAFNGVLSASDAATLSASPFANVPPSVGTPEPGTWLLLSIGGGLLVIGRQRRRGRP